jgi:hypothetical protein
MRLLRASITGEASARGECACELGKQARERISVDFDVDNPNTPPPPPSKPEARCRCDTTAGHARPLNARGAKPAPRGVGAHRASGRSTGRKLGISHPPAGERAGRWERARPRSIGTRGRRGGTARQRRAHAC